MPFSRTIQYRSFRRWSQRRFLGGPVEAATYATIKADFLERLKALLPLDGLFLPMHGAMFVEGMQDAEGDWMESARKVVGPDCLMSASYDLHGNVSQRVIDNIDLFSAFRTAPHVDQEQTMQRSCGMLLHCLELHIRPTLVWAPIPVLMPGERSSTDWQPGKRLWAQLPKLNEEPGILDVSLLVGYVWADEPRSTASAVVTGTAPATEKKIATDLAQQYWDARKEFQFGTETGTIDECIEKAMRAKTHPAILADSGDNPTGGGNSDQAEVLDRLLHFKAQNVVFAGITDKPATDACYQAGTGATLPLSIGATLDPLGSKPVKVNAKVLFLLPASTEPLREAVVQIEGVTLVLSAQRRPYHDIVDFTRLGTSAVVVQDDRREVGISLSRAGAAGESEFDGSVWRGDQPGYRSLTEKQVSQTVLSFRRRSHFSTKSDSVNQGTSFLIVLAENVAYADEGFDLFRAEPGE